MSVREEVRRDLREKFGIRRDDAVDYLERYIEEKIKELQPQPPVIERPYPELIDAFNSIDEKLSAIQESVATPKGLRYHHVVTIPSATSSTELRGVEPSLANYPKREQIHLRLKRNADVSVVNEGPGNLYIIMSSDGIHWTVDEIKIAPDGVVRLDDAYDIALRTDTDETTFRAIEYLYKCHETLVTKAIIGRGQKKWTDLWEDTISPNSMETVNAYTVPTGFKLYLAGGYISCSSPGWQLVKLVGTPGLVGNYRYNSLGDLILGPLSATIIEEGNDLLYYIYNYDYVERLFSVSLTGVLQRKWQE